MLTHEWFCILLATNGGSLGGHFSTAKMRYHKEKWRPLWEWFSFSSSFYLGSDSDDNGDMNNFPSLWMWIFHLFVWNYVAFIPSHHLFGDGCNLDNLEELGWSE